MRTGCLVLAVILMGVCANGSAQQPLSLQDALRMAERYHPRLQAMVSRRDAAQERVRAASAMLLPQVSATGWLAQGTVANMLASAPGVMPDSMRMAERASFASAQLRLIAPLFTGGRLPAMVGVSRAEAAAMSAEVQEMLQDVRLEVTERYLQALLKRRLVEVAEKQLQAQQEQTRIMETLYEQGKVPLAYVLRSRAGQAEAESRLTTARNEFQKSLLNLQEGMGVSPTGEVSLADEPAEPSLSVPADVNEAVQRGVRRRAALRAQEQRVRMAELERKSAQGALSPQAYVKASTDWSKAQNMSAQSGYTVALVLSVPIWTGGQLQAQVQEASARIREEQANLRSLHLRVENEVRQAWLDMHAAEVNVATAKAYLQNAEEAYRVAVMRVNEGRAPLVEQIDALAALTEARTRLFEAETEHLLARARLLRAMGEL